MEKKYNLEKNETKNNNVSLKSISFLSLQQNFYEFIDKFMEIYKDDDVSIISTMNHSEGAIDNFDYLKEIQIAKDFKKFLQEVKNYYGYIISKIIENTENKKKEKLKKQNKIRVGIVIIVLQKMLDFDFSLQKQKQNNQSTINHDRKIIEIGKPFSYIYYIFQCIIADQLELEKAYRVYLKKADLCLIAYINGIRKKYQKNILTNIKSFSSSLEGMYFDEEKNIVEMNIKLKIIQQNIVTNELYFSIRLYVNPIYFKLFDQQQQKSQLKKTMDETIIIATTICNLPSLCLIT